MKIFSKLSPKIFSRILSGALPLGPGIPKEGCYLEDLKAWDLINPPLDGHSYFCWDNFGKDIVVHDQNQGEYFLTTGERGYAGKFTGHYDPIITGNTNWVLPFAKYVDANNVVGLRLNRNASDELQIEVVQRSGGTWQTIMTTPAPGGGDYEVLITDDKLILYVDGNLVVDQSHDIAGEAYFGIYGTQWISGEQVIVYDYLYEKINILTTPCMTSNTEPYGVASDSYHLSGYDPWKGMNCTSNGGSDAWIIDTDSTPPAWLQWFFDGAVTMVPIHFWHT